MYRKRYIVTDIPPYYAVNSVIKNWGEILLGRNKEKKEETTDVHKETKEWKKKLKMYRKKLRKERR